MSADAMKNQKKLFDTELLKIVKVLKRDYKPQKIILFGSVARGDYNKNSDLDIQIVKDGIDSVDKHQRHVKVNSLFPHNLPVDVLVYTPYELQKRLFLADPFIKTVLNEGKIVYGS